MSTRIKHKLLRIISAISCSVLLLGNMWLQNSGLAIFSRMGEEELDRLTKTYNIVMDNLPATYKQAVPIVELEEMGKKLDREVMNDGVMSIVSETAVNLGSQYLRNLYNGIETNTDYETINTEIVDSINRTITALEDSDNMISYSYKTIAEKIVTLDEFVESVDNPTIEDISHNVEHYNEEVAVALDVIAGINSERSASTNLKHNLISTLLLVCAIYSVYPYIKIKLNKLLN